MRRSWRCCGGRARRLREKRQSGDWRSRGRLWLALTLRGKWVMWWRCTGGRWSGLLSLAGCRFCFRRRGCMGSRRRRKRRRIDRFAGDFRGCWRLSWVRCLRRTDIPELAGMKHSSLDRMVELGRLALRDAVRPEFRIYTGNDLGINMIEYGSDYLLGLATFAPEKFAERDRLWAAGDPEYYALSDALQYLGNVAFREPVPAYKHSAAVFLQLTGRIPTDLPHPRNPKRPIWEREILQDCARRLS